MVQFEDGSMIAQMGVPDMKLPIQVALAYPGRIKNTFKRLDFMQYPSLSFEKPDKETFANLTLAYTAIEQGGVIPTALNAANEVVVAAFLNEEIGFLTMSDIVEQTMSKTPTIKNPTLEDFFATDQESRAIAREMILNKTILFHNKH